MTDDTNKSKYRKLCSKEPIKLFSKDWWLDAVCGEENWDVAIVEQNGELIAAMPYYMRKKSLFTMIGMPPLTQTMGPWVRYSSDMKYSTRLSFEKKVYNQLIDQLPEVAYFRQNFDYTVTNWLPFYWRGFKETTRYTYVVDNLADLDSVYLEFDKKKREKIRKAEGIVVVRSTNDLEVFYGMNEKTFRRQKMRVPYSLLFLKRIDEQCTRRDCRKILLAEDKDGRIHSALYLVWDEQSVFLLMSGSDPELKNSDAKTLLVWEAMKLSSEKKLRFDFEGSMMESVEQFDRGFGGVQKRYFSVWKANSKLFWLLLHARRIGKNRR